MLSRSWKRRRLLASQAKQQRLRRRQRMWMMERLEVRAAPGSMLVDVSTLAGHPIAGAGHAAQALAGAESSRAENAATAKEPTIQHDRPSTTGDRPAQDRDTQPRAHEFNRTRADSERPIASSSESGATARDRSDRDHAPSNADRSRAASTEATAALSTGLDDPLADLLNFEFTTEADALNEAEPRVADGLGSGSLSGQSPDPSLDTQRESPWGTILAGDRAGSRARFSSSFDQASSASSGYTGSVPTLSSSLPAGETGTLPIAKVATSAGSSYQTSPVVVETASGNQPASTLTPREAFTTRLGFTEGLAGWTTREMGGSETGRGTVTAGSAVLREGDSFLVSIEREYLLTDDALSLSFTYEAFFDTTDTQLINDAFEAALLDSDGFSLADTFRTDRDSYYNVTEGLPPALGAGATVEEIDYAGAQNGRANRVTLDVRDVPDQSESLLVFRLVNNDSDTQTYARIFDVELTGIQSSSISGYVYADVNNDGVKDADEHGLPGVTITLAGPVERTIQTGADGSYHFDALPDGVYSVSQTQPTGYLDGIETPGQPLLGSVENDRFFDLTLSNNVPLVNYNFGERQNNAITGYAYVDVNNDGVKDADELGLPGVTITLAGPVERTIQTGADGSYRFDALPDGVYSVSQTQPIGYLDGIDTPGQPLLGNVDNDRFIDLNLAGNVALVNFNFGERPNNSISGFVYLDVNNDGVKDADEVGLPGVTITLGGPIERTIVTGPDGLYQFDGLPDGVYTISQTHLPGYLDGIDTPGQPLLGAFENDRFVDVNLSGNVALVNYNFGERPVNVASNSISGFVYVDVNNNGVKDAEEHGLPGVTITLSGPVEQTVITGDDGSYLFEGLPDGMYSVSEMQPAGYLDGIDTPGQPLLGSVENDRFIDLNLSHNVPLVNYNFGERLNNVSANSISGFVYADVNNNGVKDAVELALPNVPISLSGPVSRTIVTGVDGSYRFDDLPVGTYTVTETQPLAFLDGKDTLGPQMLGLVANDRFYDIALPADVHATDYSFGERGLRAELISKRLYLASNPSGTQLASRVLAGRGTGWFWFTAAVEGSLLIHVPEPFTGGALELYTADFMPVMITRDQSRLLANVLEGETYIVHVWVRPNDEAVYADFSITPQRLAPGKPPFAVDVNEDGWVTPIDVLLVINHLNQRDGVLSRSSDNQQRLDVNRDEFVTPLDALLVINYLNQPPDGEGESETQDPAQSLQGVELSMLQDHELLLDRVFRFWGMRNGPMPKGKAIRHLTLT